MESFGAAGAGVDWAAAAAGTAARTAPARSEEIVDRRIIARGIYPCGQAFTPVHAAGARAAGGGAPAPTRRPPRARAPVTPRPPTSSTGGCPGQCRVAPNAIELLAQCTAIPGYSEPVFW